MTADAANGRPLLAVKDLNVHYGRAHVLQDVSFEMGHEPVSLIGRNGMGKTTLCNAIMQIPPAHASGSIVFEGTEIVGRPSYKIAGAGHRLRPPGAPAVRVAHRRRAPAHGGAAPREPPLDARRRLRALPAPGRAPPERRHAALRRRAADARHRPRAAGQPQAADHGRALRGARADDHRDPDRDLPRPRRRRPRDPRGRAEPRHGHRDGRAPARDGRPGGSWPRRRRPSSSATPSSSAATSAWSAADGRPSSSSARWTPRASSTASCAIACARRASTSCWSTRACWASR